MVKWQVDNGIHRCKHNVILHVDYLQRFNYFQSTCPYSKLLNHIRHICAYGSM